MDQITIPNLAIMAVVALLGWGVFTVNQLSISTASLSKSVEYLVVENLPSRVTTLEVLLKEVARDAGSKYIQE